jgi:toxin HigB-1
VIKSFACKDTEELFRTGKSIRFNAILSAATRKLTMIDAAVTLSTLRSPPGNRLESLEGNRDGQHSIRINDKWRVCLRWTDAGAEDVEITDYH